MSNVRNLRPSRPTIPSPVRYPSLYDHTAEPDTQTMPLAVWVALSVLLTECARNPRPQVVEAVEVVRAHFTPRKQGDTA